VALAAAFTERTKDPNPHAFAALSHSGVKAFAAAIAAAGGKTDTPSVIDALETVKFQTAKGEAYFRKEDHQIITSGSCFSAVSAKNDAGWEVKDFASINFAPVTNPPEPGQTFKI
jgi:branched-chain amino acid transport system substrate-binding protein